MLPLDLDTGCVVSTVSVCMSLYGTAGCTHLEPGAAGRALAGLTAAARGDGFPARDIVQHDPGAGAGGRPTAPLVAVVVEGPG